ncbi:MAG: TetR/AcrR family transcriptional regulator [Rhodobacteraceae bacterium]|nr:TetR/AcrR family transcriptional regulator [Paracoccaceae bacterium]
MLEIPRATKPLRDAVDLPSAKRILPDHGQLIRIALALFWSRGHHATSLKDLEAALDMRPGSIHAAFGSKAALVQEALAQSLSDADGPLAGLAAHVRGLGQQMAEAPPSRACMLMKTFVETMETDPTLRAAAEDMMRQTDADFADAFADAQARGDLPDGTDPAHLASRLQAEIFGLRAYAQRSEAEGRIAEMVEDVAQNLEGGRI